MKKEAVMMRNVYTDLLLQFMREDTRIVVLEADLAKAAGTLRIQNEMPERFFEVGVAEASMISTAAGMSAMGKIPFTHSFTPFTTRRVCDQLTLSVAYAGLNIKCMGSDPGICAELNGGTHMSMEDVSIMRNIPGMVIFEPVDSVQLKKAFPQILYHNGSVYIRLLRKEAISIYDESIDFHLGKGIVLQEGIVLQDGFDVSIFASGIMVAEALEAGEILKTRGIQAEIINIHTIKPLDIDLVVKSAKKTHAVVTAENHSVIGGLGSAVAETLCEHCPVPLKRIGVKDHFGEVGLIPFLQEKYNMTSIDIVDAAMKVIERKGGMEYE